MTATTKIQWAQNDDGTAGRSWNPVRGCSRTSPGCTKCYAEKIAVRFSGVGLPFDGFARRDANGEAQWTGRVELVPSALMDPLGWRKPTRVFTNSMSDLFHPELPDDAIDKVIAVMMICSLHERRGGHTFQTLTKRAERMSRYFNDPTTQERVARAAGRMMEDGDGWLDSIASRKYGLAHPLMWFGVSVESQKYADERIPHLLATPAAVRFVSFEPLLGPVVMHDEWIFGGTSLLNQFARGVDDPKTPTIDWGILGSESGVGARPMDVAWAASLRDQMKSAEVACFTKQIATPMGRKAGDPKGGEMTMYWPGGASAWPREFPEVSP